MRLAVVDEGRVLAYIPDPAVAMAHHGLEPAWLPVFYNPRMEPNRDLSVLALQVYIDKLAPRRPVIVVEPLAATGIRALRYALEVEGVLRVYSSDIEKAAFRLGELNISLNNAWDKVMFLNADANALMYSLKAQNIPVSVVDLDPYGSPAPFLEAALKILGDRGLLMVTATDTAVLEGSKRFKALRRYGVNITKTPCSRELAVRALLGYIARVAASNDKWIKPLLSVYIDYYIRIVVQVRRGAREAQRMLENSLGNANYYPSLGYVTIRPNINQELRDNDTITSIGPLWVKELLEREFIENVIEELRGKRGYLRTRKKLENILITLREEALVQDEVYQKLDSLASKFRKTTPSRSKLLEALRSAGFKASPTHFHPMAVRTDARLEELIKYF